MFKSFIIFLAIFCTIIFVVIGIILTLLFQAEIKTEDKATIEKVGVNALSAFFVFAIICSLLWTYINCN